MGEHHKKEVVLHPLVNPVFSILDPEYTFTVPEYHSMAGVADILCHLMEQYFTPDVNAKVQDRMNEGVMKVVMEDATKILADPKDYDARANIMWASSMALAGFQFLLAKPGFPFPLHGMGHELSANTIACSQTTLHRNSGTLMIFAVGRTVLTTPGAFDPVRLAPEGQTLHGDHAYVFYQIPVKARPLTSISVR